MISEEDLLKSVIEGIEKSTTTHYVIVDTKKCKHFSEKSIKINFNNEKIAWMEPRRGVYIINTHILLHFKSKCDSITNLFLSLTRCGYLIKSKRFIVPIIKSNFRKKPTARVAIVTMFSQKAYTIVWENFLKRIKLPPKLKIDVILGDNSHSEKIFKLYKKIKSTYKNKFNNFYLIKLKEVYAPKINEHYLEIDKHIHVANCYSELLKDVVINYDYILKVEDDMEPPEDGLIKLYKNIKTMEKTCKVACVAGYYPQKLNPNTACISLQPEVWGKIPNLTDIPERVFQVEMQGGGFAIFNCKALEKVLPYNLTFKMPRGHYYMTGWDGTIGEKWKLLGWKQYCDGTLFCKHLWMF